MNAYVNYLIEANIGLILFMVAYGLFLRNETDFKIKRVFLLTGIFVSLIFPLLHFRLAGNAIPTLGRVIPALLLPEITITADGHAVASPPAVDLRSGGQYLQWMYITGLCFFCIRFLVQLFELMRVVSESRSDRHGRIKIIELAKDKPTFSFFNVVVVGSSDKLSPDDKQKIIRHESVHVKQLHSFDILLINILGIFFWFNPLIKKYKILFVQLHEFEADARAVENRDVDEYCNLLAKVALESAGFKLANHFNNSLTLKRIEMMRTIKHKIKPWKLVFAAGVIPLAFFIVSCQDQLSDEVAEITQSSTMAIEIPDEVRDQYNILRKVNPDKKFLLMETDENMTPKVAEMKTKLESLDQRQIGHITLITPKAAANETPRTFAIVEYSDDLDDFTNLSKNDADVYTIVEESAMPTGGMSEFYNHIAQKLRYPAQARRMGIEGKVFVEFVVQTDGSITDVNVKNGIGAGCDQEAVNVIAASPKWTPGKNKGVAVKQRLVVPISFKLAGSVAKDVTKSETDAMEDMVVVGKKQE